MLIRITTPMGPLPATTPVTLVPDPLHGGLIVTARAGEGGVVQVATPPRVFRVEAMGAGGERLSSRPIARPEAFASTELMVRLHPAADL